MPRPLVDHAPPADRLAVIATLLTKMRLRLARSREVTSEGGCEPGPMELMVVETSAGPVEFALVPGTGSPVLFFRAGTARRALTAAGLHTPDPVMGWFRSLAPATEIHASAR